jgi:hypothetical protein
VTWFGFFGEPLADREVMTKERSMAKKILDDTMEKKIAW